ncbi:hypothetical protein [Streptomyces sp. Ru62]|uniref:hypothetical protein n=1 Tax=Streptomyces sp. Ru62 TaxID=2080745 RepID=UPI0035BBA666
MLPAGADGMAGSPSSNPSPLPAEFHDGAAAGQAEGAADRGRVAAVVHVAFAAVDVTATVFVVHDGGRFHRRHLLPEARRHLALVLHDRRRDPGLDDRIVAAAISTHCPDISEPKTARGLEPGYRLLEAVGSPVTCSFRELPAVLACRPPQQTAGVVPHPPPQIRARKPARHPGEYRLQVT